MNNTSPTPPPTESSRQFRRRTSRWPLVVALIAGALIAAGWVTGGVSSNLLDAERFSLPAGDYLVKRVEPDATLLIEVGPLPNQGLHRVSTMQVSMMGIQIQQPQSAQRLLQLRLVGERVRLRFDRRRLDQHGGLQAYVYHGPDLMNAWLVASGTAKVDTHPSDVRSVVRQLNAAAREAADSRR